MWTLNLLQDGASRVANQARPADYDTLMRNLTRRYTDGNDEFHYRNALSENRQTGSIEDYVSIYRFLDLSSRVPNLPDAEAKFALVKGKDYNPRCRSTCWVNTMSTHWPRHWKSSEFTVTPPRRSHNRNPT